MLLAFTLATFGWWSVVDFALSHVIGLGSLGLVATIAATALLYIFMPGAVPLIRTAIGVVMQGLRWLIGTTTGRVILLSIACLAAGWSARAYVDHSFELHRQLEAKAAETEAAQQAAAKARLQAALLDQANADASRRAEAAEAEKQDLEEQAADVVDELEATEKTAGAKRACCAMTAADIAALARIGAPRAAKP